MERAEQNSRDKEKEFLTRLGERIKEFRRARDMSQEALAEAADLVQHYVSQVEQGERNISITTCRALAKALGVTLIELLAGLE